MSNNYYSHGSFPSTGSAATSASMRAELDLVTAGFDKLPTLTSNANKFVLVNGTSTGLTATSSLPTSTATDTSFTVQNATDNTKTFQFLASAITAGTLRVYTMPDASTTLVGTTATQTLTNKTLTAPIFSSIVNTGVLTLPTSTDTLVGRATTDTLTNKTLTAPVISSIVNTGVLTLPTSTDTLVGRDTTDTLTNKTLVAPALGTPASGVATNLTGTAAGLTAGNVTTNANLTGAVTSVGNAASLGAFTSLQLLTALTDETGTGASVFATSPTLVTPALGTPSALVGTNITGTAAGLTAGNVTTNANLTGPITSVGNATTIVGPIPAVTLSGTISGGGNQINNVIIGTVTPLAGSFTNITGSANAIISVTDNTNAALRITQLGTGNALLVEDTTNPDASPFVIDASGDVIIGATSSVAGLSAVKSPLQVNNAADIAAAFTRFSNDASDASVQFLKSRNNTYGSQTIVQSGDNSGTIRFGSSDGVAFIQAALISAAVDGTPGINDMPGRLVFSTTADGASSPTERMRISSTGQTTISGNAIISVTDNTNAALRITQLGTGDAFLVEDQANPDATPFVINNAGNTFIGYGTSLAPSAVSGSDFQVNSVGTTQASITASQWTATGSGSAQILLTRSLSGVRGTQTIVTSGTALGKIRSFGSDGTNLIEAASIEAYVDGTPGTNDMPGRLVFSTTADGASSTTERMRIDNVGNVGIGTSAPGYKLQVSGTLGVTGDTTLGATVTTGLGVTTGAAGIELGGSRTGDGDSYIDFHSTSGSDNEFRIIRSSGTNGNLSLANAGTGIVAIKSVGVGSITFSIGGTDRLTIGGAGVVTMSAYGVGTATFSAAGVISSVSDETYKIKDGVIADPIPMVMALETGYYYGKPEANMGDGRQLGFYAQNVRAAIGPEAAPDPETYTVTDEDGVETIKTKPWGYYDRSVLAVAIEAIKVQQAQITALTARIAALEQVK